MNWQKSLTLIVFWYFAISAASAAQPLPPSTILDIAWSSDGTFLAIGGTEGLQVTDTTTNTALSGLQAIFGTVWAVEWSPDDNYLAISDDDNTIQIWEIDRNNSSASLIEDFNANDKRIGALAWSPDGTILASGTTQDTALSLQTWDATDNFSPLNDVSAGPIASIEWTSDSSQIILMTTSIGTLIFDANLTLLGPDSSVRPNHIGPLEGGAAIALHANGRWLASSSFIQPIIYIWDIVDDIEVGVLTGHTDSVITLDWQGNTDILTSVSLDGTIRVWDVSIMQQTEEISTGSKLYAVDWQPGSRVVAFGGEQDTADLVDFNNPPTAAGTASAGSGMALFDPLPGDPLPTLVTITFDATASADPDGSIVDYEWNYQGTSNTVSSGSNPVQSVEIEVAGCYTPRFTLTVTDDYGATDSINTTLQNYIPGPC